MSTQSQGSGRRVTVLDLQEMKERGEPIAVLTAYDFLFARLVDTSGTDVVLVGDSLAHVLLGLDSTLSVTLDDMIHHARAVRRGVERAFMVVDMPFLSYQVSPDEAVRNAGRIVKESEANAVKVEGAAPRVLASIEAIVQAGIPVMGHIGYTPQSTNALGGARVQGRTVVSREKLLRDALRIEEAGAFSIVLELMPGTLAADLTADLRIPTIGIGAGPACDGQVLVLHDMLGLNRAFQPRFLRHFEQLGERTEVALREFVRAVKEREYPTAEHTFD